MGKTTHPASFPASEFEVIETALMETARGRWFLAEFARRNRTADTELLLDAIARLESSVTESEVPPEFDRIRLDLVEMSETIARTRQDIASIRTEDDTLVPVLAAVEVFDAIASSAEKTSSDILSAAEQVQETAWQLRQRGTDVALCDELDQLATSIHAASSYQDITQRRTQKAVGLLRHLESRVNTMINVWGLDDIEVIQQELGGQAGGAEMRAAAADQLLAESDVALGPDSGADVAFVMDDVPVDLESLPRVAQSDADAIDIGSPEMDIISVENTVFQDGAWAPADEDESTETGTDPVADASSDTQTSEPTAPSLALLDDDHDLFESAVPVTPTAEAADEDAPAPECAPELDDETGPAEPLETPAAAPPPPQDAPLTRAAAEPAPSAVRSTAERISRLTPEERVALFS